MDQGCKIRVSIACRKLKDKDTFSKSDPQVFLYGKSFINGALSQQWQLLGKTEKIMNNLNPNFETTFILDYIFEVKQPIRFQVKDIDGNDFEDLGSAETTIGLMFGSRNQTLQLPLSNGGTLITMCEKYEDLNELYIMQIRATQLPGGWCSSPNPNFKIFKCSNQNEFFAYHSEVAQKTSDPQWKTFQLKQFSIGVKFKIEVYDNTKIIGSAYILITDLKNNHQKPIILSNGSQIIFNQFSVVIKPSFMDYLQSGCQLNLSLAIDFTGSNGNQNQPNSLHAINSSNQYMQALTSVGEILLAYDYDKLIPCFGFGAMLNFPQLQTCEVTHCFPLSGDPTNTQAFQMDGIIQMYQNALKHVAFSGPTYFGPIIIETMKIAQQIKMDEANVYLVLLIITDGSIHDMSQVQQLLEQAAFLPMSIIIIGVGNDDFQLMQQLDGDVGNGAQMYSNKRDLVQFVPFREFKNSMLLAKEVLAELPDQLVAYMEQQGIKPKPKPEQNLQNFAMTVQQQQQQQ